MLIKEYPLMVLPSLAVAIGLNEAIVLQQVHYWLQKSGKLRDNRKWIYNTYHDWQAQFPFWSVKTLWRTISNLEREGYLVTSNYNRMKIDRTKWYSIDYNKLPTQETSPFGQNDQMDMDNLTKPITRDYTGITETRKTVVGNHTIYHDGKYSFCVKNA